MKGLKQDWTCNIPSSSSVCRSYAQSYTYHCSICLGRRSKILKIILV